MAKRNALGRGLGALIDDADQVVESTSSSNEIEISRIEANPFQPRTNFDQEALSELAVSIKEIGIIQPITLRNLGNEKYQIIAGERRFRAAKLAGLKKVPAFIREAGDEEMLEIALVENIQREDLDAIEVALSYQRLIEECSLTQESLSDRVGKKRSTVSNYLRLLKLPAIIQKAIRDQEISMGHARALVNIKDSDTQTMIYRQIMKYDFTVRKVEEIVRKINSDDGEGTSKRQQPDFQNEYNELKEHLKKHFNSAVDFKINGNGKGKIVIPFNNSAELEKIIGIFDQINS